MSSSVSSLPDLLSPGRTVVVPGVWDTLTAGIARRAGFAVVGIAGTSVGLADEATRAATQDLDEMVDVVRRVSAAAELPVIVDGEDGWGGPREVAQAVGRLESAGGAALILTDQEAEFGPVLPEHAVIDKIRAATESRRDENFSIIFRTAVGRTGGRQAVVDRLEALAEAGADIALIIQTKLDELAEMGRQIRLPIMTADGVEPWGTPLSSYADAGVSLLLCRADNPAYASVAEKLRECHASLAGCG